MFRKMRLGIAALPALLLSLASADAIQEAAGVNLSADEGFGARHTGMATSFAGFQRDANAVANAPAAMNDVNDFAFATAHAEKFGEAKYDDFAFLLPFEAHSTMGLGISRYGVSKVDLRPEGVTPTESTPFGEFSVADYLVVAAFSRRWNGLDVGANLQMLYRQLDQDGFGVRADAMAAYTWSDRFRVGALLKGLIPSTAKWQSGYAEYEPSDIQLGAAALFPAPYFYGNLEVDYQTEGLFQQRAKSQAKLVANRAYQDVGQFLGAGNLGAEFTFDFGLALRFGLTELYLSRDPGSLTTFGIGYNWRGMLGLDYSFTPHPDLSPSHRISIQFTPVFPKFNGRGFRNAAGANKKSAVSSKSLPQTGPGGAAQGQDQNGTPETAPAPGSDQPDKEEQEILEKE